MRAFIEHIDDTLNTITELSIEELVELKNTIKTNPGLLPLDVPRKLVDIITTLRRMSESQLLVLIDCLNVELREKRECMEYWHLCNAILGRVDIS